MAEGSEAINQYTAAFYTCGICHFMTRRKKELYFSIQLQYFYDIISQITKEGIGGAASSRDENIISRR